MNQQTGAEIRVTVNGEEREIPEGGSVAELLRLLSLPLDRVAVEVDKSIVRKREWDATTVLPGSRVEVVEFVGGG